MLDELDRGLRERLPDLALLAQLPEFNEKGYEAWVRIPVPDRDGHEIGLRVSEIDVEVHYSDGRADHGHAEKLFVGTKEEARGISQAATDFLASLIDERVVVVRYRTPILIKLLSPRMVRASLKFLGAWALPRDTYDAVWSWRGTHDR